MPELTPERIKEKDYRILFLDAFAGHHTDAIRAFCRSRGFVLIKIPGGITPINCGLDVDLHADMERDLLDLENEDFKLQQLQRPWRVPTRSRQSIVDDVASWWETFPHARTGVDSFRRVGRTCNKLPMELAIIGGWGEWRECEPAPPRTGNSLGFLRACVRAAGCHSESKSKDGESPFDFLYVCHGVL
jgi:hypothetical protein